MKLLPKDVQGSRKLGASALENLFKAMLLPIPNAQLIANERKQKILAKAVIAGEAARRSRQLRVERRAAK